MANHHHVARSWLETLIEYMTGQDRAFPDDDGFYFLQNQQGAFYAHIEGDEPPILSLFAVVVADLECSSELLTELNTINTRLIFPKVFWWADQVRIETKAIALDTTHHEFSLMCNDVANAAGYFGQQILSTFGGTPVFQPTDEESTDESTTPHRPGYI